MDLGDAGQPEGGAATDPTPFEELVAVASALTHDLGLGQVTRLQRLKGGRNNRVYRIETTPRVLFMKQYFRDTEDPRDRLGAEFAFVSHLWRNGVRTLAEPLLADTLYGLTLSQFVDGHPLQPGDIEAETVSQAVDFVLAANRNRDSAEARALPFAAEAVFCIADHLDVVEARVQRLSRIEPSDDVDRSAVTLIQNELLPRWQEIRQASSDEDGERNLGPSQRILSPSDFGFHNALGDRSGRLKFFDFEYAGWDDPAKLVCDFFCQVEVPVPRQLLPEATDRLIAQLGLEERHHDRIARLMPVYQLKWCCIVLNEFLPAEARRRRFANPGEDRRAGQLEKATRLLDGLR